MLPRPNGYTVDSCNWHAIMRRGNSLNRTFGSVARSTLKISSLASAGGWRKRRHTRSSRYFTNLAKCGRRGAYRTGYGGKLNARIKHCLPYLKDELTLGAGRHTTIVFGKPATKAVAKMFGIRRVPPMTEAGEFRDARERHLIFFRHWSRARAGFLDLPALDNHFRQHPV